MPLTPQQIVHYYYSRGGEKQYTPLDFPEGLRFWFDASQENYSDNDPVTTLTDLSGNGATLTAVATREPVFKSDVDGFKAIQVIAGDVLRGVKAKYNFLHQGNSTWYIVARATQAGTFFDTINGSAGSNSVGRSIGYGTNVFDLCSGGVTGSNVWQSNSGADSVELNKTHVVVFRYEAGKVGNDHEAFVDNVQLASSQGTLSPSAAESTGLPTFFARHSNLNSNNWAGYIFEMFAYDVAHDDDTMSKLLGGLNFG